MENDKPIIRCANCLTQDNVVVLIRKNVTIIARNKNTPNDFNFPFHEGIVDDYFCHSCFSLILKELSQHE